MNSSGLPPSLEMLSRLVSIPPESTVALNAGGSTPITGGSAAVPRNGSRTGGRSGSLWTSVSVPALVPARTGVKRTVNDRASSGGMLSALADGANAGRSVEIESTRSRSVPRFSTTTDRSLDVPTNTVPKSSSVISFPIAISGAPLTIRET